MKKIIIPLIPVLVIVLGFLAVSFDLGYVLFSSEGRVDRYLRNYSVNLNIRSRRQHDRIRVTHNHSDLIFKSIEMAEEAVGYEVIDPLTGELTPMSYFTMNSMFSTIIPPSNRDEILDIYNRINNTTLQYLPDNRTLFDDYTIYITHLLGFHGIHLNEVVFDPYSGDPFGMPATWQIISFHSSESRNRNSPALIYILAEIWPFGNVFEILPIDIDHADFVPYYESLWANYIELLNTR